MAISSEARHTRGARDSLTSTLSRLLATSSLGLPRALDKASILVNGSRASHLDLDGLDARRCIVNCFGAVDEEGLEGGGPLTSDDRWCTMGV